MAVIAYRNSNDKAHIAYELLFLNVSIKILEIISLMYINGILIIIINKNIYKKNISTFFNFSLFLLCRDLIKILILREILGGHNRPPFPGGPTMPPRPPFPRPHGPIIPR